MSEGIVLRTDNANAPIRIVTGGNTTANERIRILSTGNVGIGNTTPTSILDVNNSTTVTATAGANLRVLNVQGAITEAGSGTHTRLMGVEITPPTITAGVATVTDTATLYISDAPTATVSGINHSLWVDAGPSRFDGRVLENKGTNVASAATITLGAMETTFS